MSRNSKNARLHSEARARKGTKGPSQTVAVHGKRNRTKWNRADRVGPDTIGNQQE